MGIFYHCFSKTLCREGCLEVVLHAICYAVNYTVQHQDERLQLFHKLSCPPAPDNGSFVRCGGRMLERPQAGIPGQGSPGALETFPLPPSGFSPFLLRLRCILGDDASTEALNGTGFTVLSS